MVAGVSEGVELKVGSGQKRSSPGGDSQPRMATCGHTLPGPPVVADPAQRPTLRAQRQPHHPG